MLRTLFVLAILIPGVVRALVDRFAALLLYVWFGLFRPEGWLWVDISDWRPSLVLGILLVVPCLAQGILPDLSHPLSIGAVLFFASALLAQFSAVDPATGWIWIEYLGKLVLVCLLAVRMVNTRARFALIVTVMAASFGFHSAKAGVASLLGGGVRFYEGLAGTFPDNNGYALAMAMIIPYLILAGQLSEHRLVRLGFFAAAAASAHAVISTFSRGGILALGASMLVFVALRRRRAASIVALGTLALVLYAVVPLPEGYLERVQTIATYEEIEETSALSRWHFWRVAEEMVLARPLGVGLRNYQLAFDDYDFLGGKYGRRRDVHSSHFQVLAEQGFLGAGAYVFVFVCGIWLLVRMRRRSMIGYGKSSDRFVYNASNALLASIVAFLVGGSFISLALNDLTWLTFALIAALGRMLVAETMMGGKTPRRGAEVAVSADRWETAWIGSARTEGSRGPAWRSDRR